MCPSIFGRFWWKIRKRSWLKHQNYHQIKIEPHFSTQTSSKKISIIQNLSTHFITVCIVLLVIATNLTLIYVKVTKIIFLCVLQLLPNKNAITKNQLKQNFYVKKNNSLITSNKKGFCFSSQIIFGKKKFLSQKLSTKWWKKLLALFCYCWKNSIF